jgi:hypothetical protein
VNSSGAEIGTFPLAASLPLTFNLTFNGPAGFNLERAANADATAEDDYRV